ncbi:MAG TPA: hypothetical protein VFH35_11650 [Ramlibacter sp.]|nr:hypothetical protein [Ramlibacter sp.]
MWFVVNCVTVVTCEIASIGLPFTLCFQKLPRAGQNIMRWLKPNLRNSIYGLLGHPSAPSESTLLNATEDIREAMLNLLGETGPKRFPQITRRVRYANDIQALWYLRGDLMAALAALDGEGVARRKVQGITEMFRGLLPGSLTSRPSPLMG